MLQVPKPEICSKQVLLGFGDLPKPNIYHAPFPLHANVYLSAREITTFPAAGSNKVPLVLGSSQMPCVFAPAAIASVRAEMASRMAQRR